MNAPSIPTMPAQRIDASGRVHVNMGEILRLAAPLMVTNAVQSLLNLTDLWFIGRLSTDAVAAMGAIYWILTCAVLLFGGVGLAWVGVALCGGLLGATRILGRAFETRRSDETGATRAAA